MGPPPPPALVSRGHQIRPPLNPLPAPEEIAAAQHPDIPRLRLPDPASLFRGRAARLRRLADRHAAGDYLCFLARLADLQQQALDRMAPLPLPAGEVLAQRRAQGLPPLDARCTPRDPAWQGVLRGMTTTLLGDAEGALRAVLQRLLAMGEDALEEEAQVLLCALPGSIDAALAPLLAAALQVRWVHLLCRLDLAEIPPAGPAARCPACGSPPVASVMRIGAAEGGYRYLQCALCALEWHRVRVTCTHCGGTAGIHYQSIDDGRPPRSHAVQAECCDPCGSYLKIVHMDRDPQVEAVADDLATLALDLLLDASGLRRRGVNFLLIPGDVSD